MYFSLTEHLILHHSFLLYYRLEHIGSTHLIQEMLWNQNPILSKFDLLITEFWENDGFDYSGIVHMKVGLLSFQSNLQTVTIFNRKSFGISGLLKLKEKSELISLVTHKMID